MKPTVPPEIRQVVDSADHDELLLIYVKKSASEQDAALESSIQNYIANCETKFRFHSICIPGEAFPFPQPYVSHVYVFLAKTESYFVLAPAQQVANDFAWFSQEVGSRLRDIARVQRMNNAVSPEVVQQQLEMFRTEDLSGLPGDLQLGRNLLKSMWSSTGFGAPRRQLLVPVEEAARRYSICETCPRLVEKRCTVCNCVAAQIAQVIGAPCPENRW